MGGMKVFDGTRVFACQPVPAVPDSGTSLGSCPNTRSRLPAFRLRY